MKRADTGLVVAQPGVRRTVGIILALILASALLMSWAKLASAQGSQEFSESRNRSGAATPVAGVSNSGDNSNICAPILQVINTGNVLNEQGILQALAPIIFDQYGNPLQIFRNPDDLSDFVDDVLDLEGSSIDMAPSLDVNCDQTIEQAAATDNTAAADPFAGAFAGAPWEWDTTSWAEPTFWYGDDGTWSGSDGSSGAWGWNDDGTWWYTLARSVGGSPAVPTALLVLGLAGASMLFRGGRRRTAR